MANLTIKPASTSDNFIFTDANSSPNTILTVEGQTSAVTTAGRIIYGKGVNETKGTTSYDAGTDIVTIDLATGTFFDVEMSGIIATWTILHLPAANTVAAWVVRLKNHSTAVANTWASTTASTYDDGSASNNFVATTTAPAFHWAGDDHVLTATASKVDIITFWTFGGAAPVIYSTVSGKEFD